MSVIVESPKVGEALRQGRSGGHTCSVVGVTRAEWRSLSRLKHARIEAMENGEQAVAFEGVGSWHVTLFVIDE